MKPKKRRESGPSDDVDIDVTLPYSLLTTFDEEYKRHGFSTRSEAVRESMRKQLETWTGRRY